MSLTLPTASRTALAWDEKTILENGMAFLREKNKELKLFQSLWDAAKGSDFYNNNSKLASQKVKEIAESSKNEIVPLNKKVVQLLITESSKDPSSEQTQKLQKIALASQHGLNYFASVANDTYYPTLFNWSILEATRASNKLAFCAVVLTGAGYLSKELLQYTVPCYATIPVKVSLVACIGFNAIRYLNLCYRYNSSIVKTQSMKFFFEKAIASENVKFPMTSSEFSTYEYVVEQRENVTEKSSKST